MKAVVEANVSITSNKSAKDAKIIVGTIGKSTAIDVLIKEGKIDGKALKGKVEKYIITLCNGNLVIPGSDRRGTVYGIYEPVTPNRCIALVLLDGCSCTETGGCICQAWLFH